MSTHHNQSFSTPAPTPDQYSTQLQTGMTAPMPGYPAFAGRDAAIPEAEGGALRAEVEQQLLQLSQDLYEMEICAGDVGQSMEGAVPRYMAKINQAFVALHQLSGRMTDAVPRNVVESIDSNRNPHMLTKSVILRAVGENQYTLGRMVGLESFRGQLADAFAQELPQIPLPQRPQPEQSIIKDNGPNGEPGHGAASGIKEEQEQESLNGDQGAAREAQGGQAMTNGSTHGSS